MMRNQRLLKYMTTVTPLSNILALILFVMLPIITFYLGTLRSDTNISNAKPKEIVRNNTPTPIFLNTDINQWIESSVLGITFKYPLSYSIQKIDEKVGNLSLVSPSDPQYKSIYITADDLKLEVNIDEDKYYSSIKDLEKSSQPEDNYSVNTKQLILPYLDPRVEPQRNPGMELVQELVRWGLV